MSSIDANNAPANEWSQGDLDLGPLAWVLDELRKSLDGAVKAMRRFVRDAEVARQSDIAALDASALRIARQQLHQASGALEMVGMGPPSLLLRAMESVVQKYVLRPELCNDDAAAVIERASFALIDYLESVLAGKAPSPVALFPQYRDAQALAGADRVHPADLWPSERRFREPDVALSAPALAYGPEARARLDTAVLRIVKSASMPAARDMFEICASLVGAQSDRQARAFWKICAGFFEALANGLLPFDVYVKRVASRVLMQYASLAKGESAISDRLVQDLLFFCAQAKPKDDPTALTLLAAVRSTFGLDRFKPVDYDTPIFGRFDPAMLVQARKRIAAATDTWSALAGGDRNKLKPAVDQFSLVCDSLRKLHPGSESLAQSLSRAVEATARTSEPPSAALAMEVATAVLYLQASFEELDTAGEHMETRAKRLAVRLDAVTGGAEPEPLEPWMEDLYRRVSDNQTMGSVVGELRATLGEAEKALDQYFRTPQDPTILAPVPGHLTQMRGVLSVLGLDQASLAVVRMRDVVDRLLVNAVPEDERPALFEKLGNSMGALGFLIDMLSYQRTMARKLFVYDEELGELRILAGKARTRANDAPEEVPVKIEERSGEPVPDVVARFPDPIAVELADIPEPRDPVATELVAEIGLPALEPLPSQDNLSPAQLDAPTAEAVVPATGGLTMSAPVERQQDDVDDELLEIFLEEAREVVVTGKASVAALRVEPGDLGEQTTLRRAFHTLKGSSRMVGLNDFGEAGWAMEQLLNAWLAEQKPIPASFMDLSDQSLTAFAQWADDIAASSAGHWSSAPFRASADALRLQGTVVPLDIASTSAALVDALAPEPATDEEMAALQDAVAAASAAVEPQTLVADTEVPSDALELITDQPAGFQDTELGFSSAEMAQAVPDAVTLGEEIDFSAFEDAQKQAPAEGEVSALDLELPSAPADLQSEALPEIALDVPEQLDALTSVDESLPSISFEVETTTEAQTSAEEPVLALPPIDGLDVLQPEVAVVPEAELPSIEPALESADEAVKVIDTLRIGLPLYNVFLNEADEWSRRLVTSLQEWSLELHRPLPDTAVALAHSLSGSSATVGFNALSEMARSLEHALLHAQLQSRGVPEQAAVFMAASEDIRRLLHQFAAGFLKEPNAEILEALRQILQTEVSSTVSPFEEDAVEPAQIDEPAEAEAVVSEPEAPVLSVVPSGPVAPALSVVHAGAVPVEEAVLQVAHDIDDDIDAIDVIDPDLFPIFEEEAAELLPQLGTALRQWAASPSNTGARNEVLRALHTLKGSSRLAGAMRLGEMAHRLESSIEQIDADAVRADQVEPLLGTFDALQANFDALCNAGAQMPAESAVDAPPTPVVPVPPPSVIGAAAPKPEVLAPVRLPAAAQLAPVRVVGNQSVRVRAQLLDRLINQAGEVLISRSRLDVRLGQLRSSLSDLSGNLDRLRQQLRDIELQAESQMQSRLALSKDSAAGFDPLEFDRFTRVQELTRMMAESVNDVATVQRNLQRSMEGAEDDLIAQGRQARELQRDLLRTRMVEFEGISERLYAVVRQAAKETGKQIKLDITGGSIEMDRGVLDRMTPAFEHLLRNCVAHGIENPEDRTAKGKPASGTISIDLHHEGNDVSVEFRDDGAGLNIERIKAKAVSLGLIAADANISDQEAAELIYTPGFSTASEVTGLAGRGIGMDVVRAEINALGGRIQTTTEAGKGSAFRMVLPLTTAVTQVVMLRAGDLSIGVPASLVEMVRRTPLAELDAAYASGHYGEGDNAVPFFWAGALLQSSTRSRETVGKNRPVVLFRSAAQRVALHVDEVLGNQEVVVKNLGPQLSRLPGLAGMSVLASGAVVLIYNPVALTTVYGDHVREVLARVEPETSQSTDGAQPAASQQLGGGMKAVSGGANQVPLVLVVDDSITVRRVTQRLLQREGYRVSLAADGLQALERLQEERPTVVLSDIEMPRMDGFDLARNIRADAALRDLPIIMITSRIAEKHREHAMELGVNNYLGKPYSDEELLGLIQHYARLAAPVEA
jgi:chemosensory pili system protein ChpA (sensor histidine kinase/response regulator)